MNKKGQVTVFIIIGLIILASAFLFFYLRDRTAQEITQVEQTQTPNWAEPVTNYVTDCIRRIAIQGLKNIGEHGGYIDLEDEYLSSRRFHFDPDPTNSDTVSLSTDPKSSSIPYWFYLIESLNCVDCTVGSNNVALDLFLQNTPNYWVYGILDIEQQLNRYMNRELPGCLSNFESFKEFDITSGNITTISRISENNVNFLVQYPVSVSSGPSQTIIPNFRLDIDLNLLKIYELAMQIAIYQINNQQLEHITRFMIETYSGPPNGENIPPMFWTDNKYTTTVWDLNEVKTRLKNNILGSNIPYLQVNNTRDAQHITIDDTYQQGVFDVLFLDFLNKTYPDLSVSFFYNPAWNIYLDITPKTGNVLKPTTSRSEPPFNLGTTTQTNKYEFFYDISYPVIVIIRDNRSLKTEGEEGYTFRFALEVNLKDNRDLLMWNQGQGTIGQSSGSRYDATFTGVTQTVVECTPNNPIYSCMEIQAGTLVGNNEFDNPTACNSFCHVNCIIAKYEDWTCPIDNAKYSNEVMCGTNCYIESNPTSDIAETQTLFCDREQRISGETTISVIDGKTGQSVPDAIITHGCGNAWKCPMEATGPNGKFVSKFPICIGDGDLLIEKKDYMGHYEPHVSTNPGVSESYNFVLEPLREIQVEAVYINVSNLFRVKRKLYAKTGNNILDDLYYELGFVPAVTSYGIFANILYGGGLTTEEQAIINSYIQMHVNKIVDSREKLKLMEYYTDLDMQVVVEAAYASKDAAEFAWRVTHDANYISGLIHRPYSYVFTLAEPHLSKLESHLQWLNKEMDNIQFIDLYYLNESSNINKYKSQATFLSLSEHTEIVAEKIKSDIYEQDIMAPFVQIYGRQPQTIRIVPGNYSVTIRYTDDMGVYIPAQGFHPAFNYTPAYLGGGYLNNKSIVWNVPKSSLDSASKVRFYLIKVNDPSDIQDMGELGQLEYYSKKFIKYLEPEFIP
ncbi:MAG: hypothetical protein ABIC04_03315 [Nanoarchaeota archaeon]